MCLARQICPGEIPYFIRKRLGGWVGHLSTATHQGNSGNNTKALGSNSKHLQHRHRERERERERESQANKQRHSSITEGMGLSPSPSRTLRTTESASTA